MRNWLDKQKFALWQVGLALLLLANLSYFMQNIIGWAITLVFFLLFPGYLLLKLIKISFQSYSETLVFSLGLSILVLTAGGLLLNGFHTLGFDRPLTTLPIFIFFNLIILLMIFLTRHKDWYLQLPKISISIELVLVIISLTLLPLLAAAGAIRLNNGGSNELTMIMYGISTAMFVYLAFRKKLSSIYPYAIFTIGLSILFATSLRGWGITGHDIQHEYQVFQQVILDGYWTSGLRNNPYNASLSITILPTILESLTNIHDPYIYKIIYQVLFAIGIIGLYLFIKNKFNPLYGLIGSIIFISFPPFVLDMPFLNRQEIAFIFFCLLVLINTMKKPQKTKALLTLLFLAGLILSHYSSAYTAIIISMVALLTLFLINKIIGLNYDRSSIPLLSLPVIILALLFTFMWNAQVTSSSGGLQKTISNTLNGLINGDIARSSGVSYGIISGQVKPPQELLNESVANSENTIIYVPEKNMEYTKLGEKIAPIINPTTFNYSFRAFLAVSYQILLIIGLIIIGYRLHKNRSNNLVFAFVFSIGSLILLAATTILPQLSVDYSVTRLFQQTLVITVIPIIIAMSLFFRLFGLIKTEAILIIYVAFVFAHLTGFIPQLLGGHLYQLSFNNEGTYYDIYYVHSGEKDAADWMDENIGKSFVLADYSALRLNNYPFQIQQTRDILYEDSEGYVFEDRATIRNGTYTQTIVGTTISFIYPIVTEGKDVVYNSTYARVYGQSKSE